MDGIFFVLGSMPRACRCLQVLVVVVAAGGGISVPLRAGRTADTPPPETIQAALRRNDVSAAVNLARPRAKAGQAEAQFVLGLFCDLGAGVRLDHDRALVWLKKSAAQGYALAQYYLAWKYDTGFGVGKANVAAASHWRGLAAGPPSVPAGLQSWVEMRGAACEPKFSQALNWMIDHAFGGDAVAEANLAEVYLATQWTKPDVTQHLFWLEQAANLKDPPSLERLADYYQLGLLVAKDPVRALTLRRAAAQAGNVDAEVILGRQYEEGDGVKADPSEALKWYRRAAAQDDPGALDRLIGLLRQGAPGVPKNFAEAARWAKRGAALGDPQAIVDLADLYDHGEGLKRNVAKAAGLYRRAAAKGVVWAMSMLGWLDESGELGARNYPGARKWFEAAAAKGSDYARRRLGLIYEYGQGVPKNPAKAFIWFERAARDGDGFSQNEVGWYLRRGVGIPRDNEEADGWFRLAVKNGDPMGDANLGFQYLHGRGVPRNVVKAFTHLAAASRQLDNSWTSSLLTDVLFKSSPEDWRALRPALRACLENPATVRAKGDLPELCLQAVDLVFGTEADAVARPFIQRLLAAHRKRSAGLLAWRAFTGWHMPYNLVLARKLAKTAAVTDAQYSAYLLAAIDSVSADSPAARRAARKRLHQLADRGYPLAALMLARRCAAGEDEPFDPKAAIRYFRLANGKSGKMGSISFASVCRDLGIGIPPAAPTAAELASAAARIPAAGPTSLPHVIFRPPPIYPYPLEESGLNGEATVSFVVDTDGAVQDVKVVKATHPLFAAAAAAAVRRWRFVPGKKDGHPCATALSDVLRFRHDTDELGPGVDISRGAH